MLKGRGQPSPPQVAWIEGPGLIGAVGELDGCDIQPLGTPGHQRGSLDGATVQQIDGITPNRNTDNTGSVFNQAGWRIELLGREARQLDIAWLPLNRK